MKKTSIGLIRNGFSFFSATKLFLILYITTLLLSGIPAHAQDTNGDLVILAMNQELNRSLENLKKTPVPPYFLSYEVTDNRAIRISSSFGALTKSDDHRTRVLDVVLRLGDYTLDNTHPMRGRFSYGDFGNRFPSTQVPIENDPDALRMALWYQTDQEYKQAVERFEQVKANVVVKVEQEDKSGDFSSAPAEKYFEPEAEFSFDKTLWEKKIRMYSAPFNKHSLIMYASAQLNAEIETIRYVNSDGSEIRTSSPIYFMMIFASVKAEDGMELPLHKTYMTFKPDGLPDDATVLKDVDKMIQTLLALRNAPLAEPYTGPAILSGRASAVFFHEIFGHRIEGQRQKNENESQTFKKKINKSVLPDFLSVYSDPTLKELQGTELMGYYLYDNEGVKAQRVNVVESGILRNFLMSRSPIEGFPKSNGHGRHQQGHAVVARQSNLVIESKKAVSKDELKKMLIQKINAADKPYGLIFEDIEGGFTFTQRSIPNAFNVLPTVVYRIYPDGREEMVRGVDLIGTPMIAFSKIAEADDEIGIFNGICGAESGLVSVSAVSPGLLVSQIEVQRKQKSQERAPLLPPPSLDSK